MLTDKLEIDIVELGKIKKLMEAGKISKRSKVGMWTRILLNPEEIGEEEGRREQQIEMAKKMLEKNKPIEEIMEFTELTKEEIENIENLKIEDDNEKIK